MAKGFGGMPGNIQQIMKQAQKMQEQLQRTQEQAGLLEADGSAGGGMVKVVASGKNQIVSVAIEKEVVNPDDIDMLQDLILAACNEALNKVQDKVREEVAKVTGGMNIPGMF